MSLEPLKHGLDFLENRMMVVRMITQDFRKLSVGKIYDIYIEDHILKNYSFVD